MQKDVSSRRKRAIDGGKDIKTSYSVLFNPAPEDATTITAAALAEQVETFSNVSIEVDGQQLAVTSVGTPVVTNSKYAPK